MLATTIQLPNTTPHHQARRQHQVLSQDPTVCLASCPSNEDFVVVHPVRATTAQHPSPAGPPPDARTPFVVLPRKEVIQPPLPVRLPCYDFVPIADPTFDSSLPYGLGRRLRVLPTFVT